MTTRITNLCGQLSIKTTFHNPKKMGKRTFTLTIEHATWRDVVDTVSYFDPRDTHDMEYTTHDHQDH
jgi:hypothetical protein